MIRYLSLSEAYAIARNQGRNMLVAIAIACAAVLSDELVED